MNHVPGYLVLAAVLLALCGFASSAHVASADSTQLPCDMGSDATQELAQHRGAPHGRQQGTRADVDLHIGNGAPGSSETYLRSYHWESSSAPYHTWPGYQAR